MNLYISYSPAIKSRFVIILFMICRYSVVIISVQFSSVAQSYPTLCDPMNRSTPGKYAKKLLWYVCVFSLIWLFATPWTVAHQAPLSMEFSRQEYWSRLLFPTPGELPKQGNLCLLHFPHWQMDSLVLRPQASPTLSKAVLYSELYI